MDETSEADFDDNIDQDLLREKRKEELLVYEQILFGEKPDRIYFKDEGKFESFADS